MGNRLFVAALILGFIGWLAFKFMIKTTIQRVETPVPEENVKFSILQSIGDFMCNRPALGATLLPVSMFLGSYGAATATSVMFQSYFRNTKISGLMTLIVVLPMMIFIPFVKKITVKYGKKEASAFGMIFSIIACIVMLIIPIKPDGSGILTFMVLQILNGLGMGFGNIVSNAMMADAIDYNQWKTGKREEGITYSLHSFFRKAAQGIGPSIGLVLMVMLGYDEQLGAAQPFEVALKMRYLVAALYLVSAVLMYVGVKYIYNLDKQTLDQMNKELGR